MGVSLGVLDRAIQHFRNSRESMSCIEDQAGRGVA
jgi:hypothetical protein